MSVDERFFAWLDGELEPAEAAEMEARVAADPELARAAEEHRALKAQLKNAFDPIALSPVPGALVNAAAGDEKVVDFAASKRSRETRRWLSYPQVAAMAATLAVGIFVGTMVPRENGSPIELQRGKVYAAASLGKALNTQLASAPAGETRIGMTFRDQAGAICRTFTNAASSGLACREGNGWQVRGLFAAPEGQSDSYRMAGGMDPNLAALVDSSMAGEPFDAAQEKSAKDKGWK